MLLRFRSTRETARASSNPSGCSRPIGEQPGQSRARRHLLIRRTRPVRRSILPRRVWILRPRPQKSRQMSQWRPAETTTIVALDCRTGSSQLVIGFTPDKYEESGRSVALRLRHGPWILHPQAAAALCDVHFISSPVPRGNLSGRAQPAAGNTTAIKREILHYAISSKRPCIRNFGKSRCRARGVWQRTPGC